MPVNRNPGHLSKNWATLLLVILALAALVVPNAVAQTAPYWNSGNPQLANGAPGSAIKPAPWPVESPSQWVPYSWGTTFPDATIIDWHPIRDPRVQDPSNGGTSPQNYVNVSSGCGDKTLPSIYYYFDKNADSGNGMIYFRWRVEQIANSYATGPSAGAFGSSDPWKSALWTVFFDTNGDGFRDFAAHLDGSSGSPAVPIDVLRSIWSATKTNSIDYVSGGTSIYSLFSNPTGFVDNTTQQILQFNGATSPTLPVPSTVQWPNGASETIWDYGTTRSINLTSGSCVEYYVDYEIPLRMLNASGAGVNGGVTTNPLGGPQFKSDTPFQFLFATANSLNNPFQKDIVWEGNFVCDATSPGPFGDALTLDGGLIPQPIATAITAGAQSSCAVPVTAQIMDALTVNNCQTISQLVSAQFKYWYDANGNGSPDDAGSSWVSIGDPSVPVGTTVTANWNLNNLIQGQYLLALEITDNRGHTTQTWRCSSLTDATDLSDNAAQQCRTVVSSPTTSAPLGVDGLGRHIYPNAPYGGLFTAAGGTSTFTHPITLGVNYAKVNIGAGCGAPPPAVTKTHSIDGGVTYPPGTSTTPALSSVTYKLTINNTSGTAVSILSLTDSLPAGFSYQSTAANTAFLNGGSITSSPSVNSTGAITWNFSGVSLPGATSRDFIFTVTAGSVSGTFHNSGSFVTNVGTLTGTDATGVTVTTAALIVSKTASSTAGGAPQFVYTPPTDVYFRIVVTNNSQTACANVVISDPLPTGFTFTSASTSPSQGSLDPSSPAVNTNGTVKWNLGTVGVGQTFTLTIRTIATSPLSIGPATNTATVTSTNAPTVTAATSLLVSGPVLTITKTASPKTLVATSTVAYTIDYANTGTATATGLTFADSWTGAGFAFTSATGVNVTPTCSQTGTTVNCTLAPTTLAAGTTASITLNFTVSAAVGSYQNTVTMTSTNAATQTANFTLDVVSNTCTNTNYYFRNTKTAVSNGAAGYSVGYVQMNTSGTYSGTPTVAFTGTGTGAAGTASGVTGAGGIFGVNMSDGGFGYTSAPTVAFSGGGGAPQATATAVMTGPGNNQYTAVLSSANTPIAATSTGQVNVTNPSREIIRFYSDPVATASVLGTAWTLKTSWNVSAASPAKLTYAVKIAMYDPSTEGMIYLASGGESAFGVALNTDFSRTITSASAGSTTIPANTVLPAGWRLVFIISAGDTNGGAVTTVALNFNGSGTSESFATVCLTPMRVSLTKFADKLTINPGDALTYTIQYANTSSAPLTNVVISDPIPNGTTFTSATTNVTTGVATIAVTSGGSGYSQSAPPAVTFSGAGGATARALVRGGQVYAIEVTNSGNYASAPTVTIAAGTTTATATVTMTGRTVPTVGTNGTVTWRLGTLAAGATGSLTITVATTTASLTGLSSLANTATLTSPYIPNVTDTATTVIARPFVLIAKRADNTNLVPGSTFTYTVDVVNAGPGIATNVIVTDPLPTTYLNTNGAATATSGIITGTTSLTWTIATMSPGTTATLTIPVIVKTSGIPSGQTTVTNTASVVDDFNPTARTASASVTITVPNPNVTMTLTGTPSANRVVFISVTGSCTGYVTAPGVTISAPACIINGTTCVQATATSSINTSGQLTGINITNSGNGYNPLSPPTVTVSGCASGNFTPTVGPGPGDTILYTVVVSNAVGAGDATGVALTATVPNFTTFTSFSAPLNGSETFVSGSVFKTVGTLTGGSSSTLNYTVTVDSTLPYSYSTPFGVTTLTASASGTSTNTTIPSPANVVESTGAAPRYALAKGPDSGTLPYPATTLAAAASATTSVTVASSSLLNVGDYVVIGGTAARVNAISGVTLTLSAPVSASNFSNVVVAEHYTISYSNVGNAAGSNLIVTDTLPANLLYAGVPVGAPAPVSSPSAGPIVWNLGHVSGITITSGGSGYGAAPTVTIAAPSVAGTQTTAVATITSGVVTAVTLTNPGSGYTSVPAVTFSSGTATATASISSSLASGGSGSVELLVYPTAAGIYTDTAVISDGSGLNTRNASDTATTTFGALNPSKSTTTPQVTNGSPTNVAHYVVTVQNPVPTTATSVVVTDNLPNGFTYKPGSTTVNSVAKTDALVGNPTGSSPVWSGTTLNIPGNTTLTLEFDANVASSVPTGVYENEVLVSSPDVPSLIFDYLATPQENVQVCDAAPAITAPNVCASSTGNVASIGILPSTTYSWSITNGTITNFNTGTVDRVAVGNDGTGYSVGNAVTFTGGGGSGATGIVATVSSGAVTSITIINPGSGYTSVPTVNIAGGSGATTTAVLGRGIIYTAASSGPVGLQVILTSGTCTVTQTKSVTVNTAPTITTDASSKTACSGASVTFSAVMSGASSFQWQDSSDGITWTNIAGATTSSHTVTAGTAPDVDGHQYRLIGASGAALSGCLTTSSAATLHVNCNLDLEVTTNIASPSPIPAGQNLTLTQSVSNVSGNATTQTVTFSQSVPANTTFLSMVPPAGWSCTTPIVGGTGAITCTTNAGIHLNANTSTGNFTLVLKTDPTTTDGTVLSDTATVAVTPTDTDSVAGNNSKSVSVTVVRQIDVQVVVNDTATAAPYGAHFINPGNPPTSQPMDWIISVGNGGPSMGSSVVITDTIPSGFTYTGFSESNLNGTCVPSNGNTTLTCTVGNLMPSTGLTLVGGSGSGASVYPTVSGGQITGITIVNGGSGYGTTPPTVVFSGAGTGAVATAILTNGVITGFSISNPGSGYGTPGTITIHGTVNAVQTQIADSAAATYNETDTNPSNDSSADTVSILAPTVVKILTMDGKQDRNGVTLTWKTTFEADNLGFYVWRESANGTREKISPNIIPGSALFTGKGIAAKTNRSYRFVDRGAKDLQFFQYYIEDVDLKGVHTMHGPVSPVTAPAGTTSAVTTDPDPTLGSVGGIFTTAPGMGVVAPAPTAPDSQRLSQQWTLAGSPAAKLIVTQPGWYQIKKSDLVAAGFDPGTNSRNLALFADGIEVPILVPSGSFGATDTIEFYGTGIDTPTTGGHVYYLTTKTGSGLRVKGASKASGGTTAPANFTYGFDRTERTGFFTALTNNGDRENFFGAFVTTYPVTNSLTVSNLDPQGGNATVRIVLQGANSDPFSHIVSANLNGTDLGLIRYNGQTRMVADLSVPLSALVNGENTLTLTAMGGDDDFSALETVHLSYPHTYRADANALAFTAPASSAITVTGFTKNTIRVVDLTDPQNPTLAGATITQAADGTSSAAFTTGGTGTRTLLAFADDRVLPPAQVALNEVSTLNAATNAADLVIITNHAFATAAASLQSARAAQGIKTVVVDAQNVYDEFSYGVHGPEAIRSFLQRANTSWTSHPKWVVLLGDASFDPRNYLGIGAFDFVPTKLVATQYLKTASDDWFTDFTGTATAVIPVGRIPVRTADEANAVISKLARRTTTPPAGPWASTVTLISDRVNGVPFEKGSDQLALLVGSPYQTNRLSFASLSDPATAVVNAFTNGNLLTNYLGHGSVEIWSDYVFTSTAAAALANGDKLPFVVTMNCLNGYFHDVYTESLAEALLKNVNGGAIGVWSSSALTSPDEQLKVNLELYRQIFGSTSITIGDAILKAKLVTTDSDVRRTWILFGDPSMKLRP